MSPSSFNSFKPNIDAKEVRPLFEAIGKALWAAQQLEFGMKLVLFMLSEKRLIHFDPKRANQIIDGEESRTAGQLFSILKQKLLMSEDEHALVLMAVRRRNSLVHSHVTDRVESLLTAEGRRVFIRGVNTLRREILDGDAVRSSSCSAKRSGEWKPGSRRKAA